MDVFKSNRYPENFINNYFKTFLDNKRRIQETFVLTLQFSKQAKKFTQRYFQLSQITDCV